VLPEVVLLDFVIELERGISVLENFNVCVSIYISWWIRAQGAYSILSANLEEQEGNYQNLRNKIIIKRWNDLRQQCAEYTEKVSAQGFSIGQILLI